MSCVFDDYGLNHSQIFEIASLCSGPVLQRKLDQVELALTQEINPDFVKVDALASASY